MEAPKPQLQFNENSSMNIKDNSSEYKLNFGTIGDSIYFELIDLKSFPSIKYLNIFNMTQLQGLNLWFKQFSTIDKIVKMFNKMIKSNEFKVKNVTNNQNKYIYFVNIIDEDDIILIELKKKEQNQNDIIQTLLKTVQELKEENNTLEKKMIDKINNMEIKMKNIINNMEKNMIEKYNLLEKRINKLEKENNSNKHEILEIKNGNLSLLNNSLIITKLEEAELISSWITQNKKIKYQLLYRATRDGDKEEDFHRLCDNKAPTMILGKTPGGYIFGGFTKAKWTTSVDSLYLPDSDAFVFSLNQKKKFNTQDKNRAINIVKNYITIFGNGSNSIQIENNILISKRHWSNPNGSYGSNLNLTENKYFSLVEFEVFFVDNI